MGIKLGICKRWSRCESRDAIRVSIPIFSFTDSVVEGLPKGTSPLTGAHYTSLPQFSDVSNGHFRFASVLRRFLNLLWLVLSFRATFIFLA